MRRWFLIPAILLAATPLWAQELTRDTLSVRSLSGREEPTVTLPMNTYRTDGTGPMTTWRDSIRMELLRNDYNTQGELWRYRTGSLMGIGEQNSMPGIGRINEATLLWSQQWGDRLTLQAYLTATQLDMEFLHRHVWGAGGLASYQLGERWTLKAFGSYDTGNPYNPYGRQWGGSLVWKASSHFGIEGGVRRRYNAWTHRWETEPIVAPYYQNDQLKLQLDVGPILHQLLREVVVGRSRREGPTIAPPRIER